MSSMVRCGARAETRSRTSVRVTKASLLSRTPATAAASRSSLPAASPLSAVGWGIGTPVLVQKSTQKLCSETTGFVKVLRLRLCSSATTQRHRASASLSSAPGTSEQSVTRCTAVSHSAHFVLSPSATTASSIAAGALVSLPCPTSSTLSPPATTPAPQFAATVTPSVTPQCPFIILFPLFQLPKGNNTEEPQVCTSLMTSKEKPLEVGVPSDPNTAKT